MNDFTSKHAEVFINKLFEIIARKNSVRLIFKKGNETKIIG